MENLQGLRKIAKGCEENDLGLLVVMVVDGLKP